MAKKLLEPQLQTNLVMLSLNVVKSKVVVSVRSQIELVAVATASANRCSIVQSQLSPLLSKLASKRRKLMSKRPALLKLKQTLS